MGDHNPKERRKHKRLPLREDILVSGTKQCTTGDISEGGLFISAIQLYEENDVIDVTIPFKGKKITVKAKVRYCQSGIGFGIMFTDLSDEQEVIINKLIEKLNKKST